jgi:hypothetical protein
MINKYASLRHVVPVILATVPTYFFSLPESLAQSQDCLSCVGRLGTSCECPVVPHSWQRTSPQTGGGDVYGAIAYSKSTDKIGYTDSYPTALKAQNNAVSKCESFANNPRDCKSYVSFVNGCGALYIAADTIVRWSREKNKADAEKLAQVTCERTGGINCRFLYSHCSLR